MCGMIAVQAQIIWGANLIPSGAACGGDDPRRRPTCSRMPTNGVKVRTMARSRRLAGALGVATSMCAAVRFEDSKQKARDGFLCAGFCNFRDDGVMRELPDIPPWMAHLRGAFVNVR
jgi:hypothetical protein